MIMSGCPTKRSLAYPEHSQALCSNQLVARSSAWKYVNHQSTLNIDFPTFFASEQFDILHFRGELWAWVLLPFGLSAWENRNLCNITSSLHSINLELDFATLHLAWTLYLYLDFATMSISFAVIFKSSHFNQFKSQYMVVIFVMINSLDSFSCDVIQ